MALARRLSMTAANSKTDYDAIIIGAGVIGCSIGLQLARAGWRTLNVDSQTSAGAGSTSYSSGCLRSYYRSALFVLERLHV
eukprot:SAG11_NODE_988_length_6275_cov_10.173413_7_plen_81_part_00